MAIAIFVLFALISGSHAGVDDQLADRRTKAVTPLEDQDLLADLDDTILGKAAKASAPPPAPKKKGFSFGGGNKAKAPARKQPVKEEKKGIDWGQLWNNLDTTGVYRTSDEARNVPFTGKTDTKGGRWGALPSSGASSPLAPMTPTAPKMTMRAPMSMGHQRPVRMPMEASELPTRSSGNIAAVALIFLPMGALALAMYFRRSSSFMHEDIILTH